jgi:hypothetical protein
MNNVRHTMFEKCKCIFRTSYFVFRTSIQDRRDLIGSIPDASVGTPTVTSELYFTNEIPLRIQIVEKSKSISKLIKMKFSTV